VYRGLVLLYDIYLALLCARSMLALTSATPGMPYAAVRALGISTPGRSLSRVIPAVRNIRGVRIEVALHTHVRSQVASRARVPASPTGCMRPKRGVRDLRRPPLERDFFFLMYHTNLLSRQLRLGDRPRFQPRYYQQKNHDGGIVGLLTFILQLCDR
jgi:hypothetical protein